MLKCRTLFPLLIVIGLLVLLASPLWSQTHGRTSLYWVESVHSDSVIVWEYRKTSEHKRAVPGIEVWENLVGKENPLPHIYWTDQDWKLLLLKHGFASLENPANSSVPYVDAQKEAARSHLGRWKSHQLDVPTDKSSWPSWKTIRTAIIFYGGLGAVLVSVLTLFRFILRTLRRRRLPLVFLGLHSSGKTWLWSRLINPDITREELDRLERTQSPNPLTSKRSEPMGRYEVTPVYIDLPGGKPEHHINQLLQRPSIWSRMFTRQVSIWIVLLATTPKTNVTRSSPENDKLDNSYIHQQLGYLSLPVGMLLADKVPKPRTVIVAITKLDLFSEVNSSEASSKLQGVFRTHIANVQKACQDRKVPCHIEFCSALEGWNTEKVLRRMKTAVFA